MIVEHILYNIAVALIVGLLYTTYTNRDPSWLVAVAAFLPDVDYILQFIWSRLKIGPGILTPYHGDFHNILAIVVLTLIFSYLVWKYLNIEFIDAIVCIGIGGFTHLISDMLVYTHVYELFYPFPYITPTTALMVETRKFFGIGDFNIIMMGILFISYCLLIKFVIEGREGIIRFCDSIKNARLMCMMIISTYLKL